MRRRSLVLLVLALGLTAALLPGGDARAGGWAVTTVDPLPAITPGRPVAVGFTIRQHGVTPVALDGVQVVVHPAVGETRTFAARAEGPLGHYVADVTFPAGSLRWEVVQGWFGPQDLGPLVVAASPPAAGSTPRWPEPVRWGLVALTGASAVVFVILLVGRPRRTAMPT